MDKKIFSTLVVLAPLVLSFIFAMDVYVPDLPKIVKVFHTSPLQVQITLSAFMFTTGVGQLLVGPLSDQIGRFKVAIVSAILFTLASVLCALSNSIEMLILGRILQALGGCGMLVVAFAATRDLFSGDESARMYSLLNCVVGLSPLIAPIIGSYLAVYFGWRASFWFLAILGITAILLIIFRFKETHPLAKRIRVDVQLFKRYVTILTHRNFQLYAFFVLSAMSMFFVFFSFSPYIIINVLGRPTKDFGYYFFMVGLTFFIGSYISAYSIKHVGTYKTAFLGVLIAFLAGVAMGVAYLKQGVTVSNFIIPSMILGIGGALMLGAGAGGAMDPFPEFAGTAASVLGFVEFIGSAIIGYFVLHWKTKSTVPVAVTIITLSVLNLLMCFRLKLSKRLITRTS